MVCPLASMKCGTNFRQPAQIGYFSSIEIFQLARFHLSKWANEKNELLDRRLPRIQAVEMCFLPLLTLKSLMMMSETGNKTAVSMVLRLERSWWLLQPNIDPTVFIFDTNFSKSIQKNDLFFLLQSKWRSTFSHRHQRRKNMCTEDRGEETRSLAESWLRKPHQSSGHHTWSHHWI